MAEPAQDRSHPCDWVSGACFAVRRQVFERIGLLDEGYFLYFEEVDFCRRARGAGWACWYVADARVVHHEGSATGIRARRAAPPGVLVRFAAPLLHQGVRHAGACSRPTCCGRSAARASSCGARSASAERRKLDPVPPRFALDLLVGDAKAIVRGDLRASGRRRVRRERRPRH